MCGVLMVKTSHSLDHTLALEYLSRRGPNFVVSKQIGNTFVAQTVLHVTGSDSFYHEYRSDAFAYSGEIYDYQRHGMFDNDVELAYQTVRSNPVDFQHYQGPWSWIYANWDITLYASDPQGDRCLYQYQDNDMLIVCSEVAPILTYIKQQLQTQPYANKAWTMIGKTPWVGITRCWPGQLYQDGHQIGDIDSVWSWISPDSMTFDDAMAEFESVWQSICSMILPRQSATLSYSGGIDSNLIARYMPKLDLLAIDCVGKDPIVAGLACKKIAVDYENWAVQYKELICATKMPAQSWSHVGKWLVAKHSANNIIFTGLAADELFGGYDIYQNITYGSEHSHSPYSRHDHDNLWSRCLEAYHGDARQATLLMDYWYQVVGSDAPGMDRLSGYWGKEVRNPFMTQAVIKFALNLPWHLKVANHAKPILRRALQNVSDFEIMPKQGFAGHANDALPWLDVNIDSTGNRHQDWQQIAQKTFYQYCGGNE